MNVSKIEWTDFSANPIRGLCPVDCKDKEGKSYCYARKMYKRFHWDETIRHDMTIWNDIAKIKKPSKIFVGSTMELFGKWVKYEWMEYILRQVERKSEHTFIFLTKEPQNLIQWSPFPKNCWIGCSATNQKQYNAAIVGLELVTAKVKFISFEPLLSEIVIDPAYSLEDAIQWVIIGQQTPQRVETAPYTSWINNIVREADIYRIPVFLKNNLSTILTAKPHFMVRPPISLNDALKSNLMRQEYPTVV